LKRVLDDQPGPFVPPGHELAQHIGGRTPGGGQFSEDDAILERDADPERQVRRGRVSRITDEEAPPAVPWGRYEKGGKALAIGTAARAWPIS
jgi:hypothetical protein